MNEQSFYHVLLLFLLFQLILDLTRCFSLFNNITLLRGFVEHLNPPHFLHYNLNKEFTGILHLCQTYYLIVFIGLNYRPVVLLQQK